MLLCYHVTLLLTASPHFSPTWWQILRKAGKKQPNQAGHSGCQTEQNLAMSRLGTEQFKLWAGMLVPLLGCLDKYASNYAHTVCQVQKLEPGEHFPGGEVGKRKWKAGQV